MSDGVDGAVVHLDETVKQIIDGLQALDHRYPKAAIALAREHQDEIVPLLIQSLQDEIAVVQANDKEERHLAFFALALLGEFRAKAALPTILQAISLPPEQPDELFGDAIHELLPEILETLSDSTDVFDQLIADPAIDVYVRSAAVRAYLQAVFSQRLTREAALEKLRPHLAAAVERQDGEFVTWLVSGLYDYCPRELMNEIRDAYGRGLVDGFVIGLDEFEDDLAEDQDRFADELEEIAEFRSQPLADRVESWNWDRDDVPPPSRPFRDMEFDDDDYDEGFDFGLRELGNFIPMLPPEPVPTPVGTIRNSESRVGRNEPCPCGSGKKFKKCCGGQ